MKLSGTFPYNIGQLYNLTDLSLSSNKLIGIISWNSHSFNFNPNWVPPFQLQELRASSCIFEPQFPIWLTYQRKLVVLQISNTGIKDLFPKWFSDISSSLDYLNVSHNKLSGVLPKSLQSIKGEDPSIWDFSFNNLFGPLPHFPEKLDGLFLSNNMFWEFLKLHELVFQQLIRRISDKYSITIFWCLYICREHWTLWLTTHKPMSRW